MKLAIVLFNLGGPDSLQAVKPFLCNLFSDPAIINLPAPLRLPLAWFIATRRTPFTRSMYELIGDRSPLLKETEAQAHALEMALAKSGHAVRCFIAMRYWHPFIEETAQAVNNWAPDHIVLLPLYPQYSTTTTASSLDTWKQASAKAGLQAPETRACCYPWEENFIAAEVELIEEILARRRPSLSYRLLFSAHGLPRKIIARGDPYQWQVEGSVEAILRALPHDLDWTICYQSCVGPLEWIGPQTDHEIRRAGAEGKAVIVAPVSFVSEHSETLVELDIFYAKLARDAGVPDYLRVPTVRTHPRFIKGLAGLVTRALTAPSVTCAETRICHADRRCGFEVA